MSKYQTVLKVGLLSLSASAISGIDDYELRRLPISLGDEFTNAVGDVRQFMPTSINNAGLMAGTRLTWSPDGGDRTLGVTGQASYIYDLETRTYLAQPIAGMAITSIGDEVYIGKKLHPNGKRWQTWRCPISGLVEDAVRGVWTNPGCALIDNDYLDQNVDPGDWAGFFLAGIMMNVAGNGVYTNQSGSTIVFDLPDAVYSNGSSNGTLKATYYKNDAVSMVLDDVDNPLESFPQLIGEISPEAELSFFTSEFGSDVAYFIMEPDASVSPGKVHRVELPDGPILPLLSTVEIGWMDPETGEYVAPLAINSRQDVLTQKGVCSLSSGCQQRSSFGPDFLSFDGAEYVVMSSHYFDHEIIAALINGCTEFECSPGVYFYDFNTDSFETLTALVDAKFPESVDVSATTYTMPAFLYAGAAEVGSQMLSSRNGKYFSFTTRDANSGGFRNYVMKRND